MTQEQLMKELRMKELDFIIYALYHMKQTPAVKAGLEQFWAEFDALQN